MDEREGEEKGWKGWKKRKGRRGEKERWRRERGMKSKMDGELDGWKIKRKDRRKER